MGVLLTRQRPESSASQRLCAVGGVKCGLALVSVLVPGWVCRRPVLKISPQDRELQQMDDSQHYCWRAGGGVSWHARCGDHKPYSFLPSMSLL